MAPDQPGRAPGAFVTRLRAGPGGRRLIPIILGCVGLIAGFAALVQAGNALMDAAILRSWPLIDAEVVAAEALPQRGRGGLPFHLQLRVTDAAGQPLLGETSSPYRLRGSWSEPARPPMPGDRIRVFLDPDAPQRMRPEDTLSSPWLSGFYALLYGIAGFGALALLILLLRTRAAAPPHGGDSGAPL
ncbi:DUF3592 domain-containing protein [Roseomonas hellenica]|uniref:DUF3592 domain-containing protein n=1 Tax=Plastoroseomonas hellenica TaxID=2687306 RepID=A0ABS5EZ94_9PROT|nr:DUF3592 domain-containing protein [Plastoroseomonas hellenica]MBR0665627.1 DUF3592 domain-containing protein [Plastoroseomonas hellenica]